jgi:hypothetical protein
MTDERRLVCAVDKERVLIAHARHHDQPIGDRRG